MKPEDNFRRKLVISKHTTDPNLVTMQVIDVYGSRQSVAETYTYNKRLVDVKMIEIMIRWKIHSLAVVREDRS